MGWVLLLNGNGYVLGIAEDYSFIDIPAWSLHRLFEIMYKGDMFRIVSLIVHDKSIDTIYEFVIANIEALVKIGKFNKDYLSEKKQL